MKFWHRLHAGRRRYRWPLKFLAFLLLTLLVLYPKVWLIPTTLARVADLDTLLEPTHPGLAPLEARVRERLDTESGSGDALAAVEAIVCEQIAYAWDWDNWGVMEYLPTTAEVLEKGREDCDGRAVVAASLLRRMGYDAWLVTDLLHMWVETPQGETMSPTGGAKTLSSSHVGAETERTSANVTIGVVKNLARSLSYGIAVFPLGREIVILLGLCLLTMHPWSSGWRRATGCLLLWLALDTLRHAGQQAAMEGGLLAVVTTGVGGALVVTGWLTLALKDRAAPRGCAAEHPE